MIGTMHLLSLALRTPTITVFPLSTAASAGAVST